MPPRCGACWASRRRAPSFLTKRFSAPDNFG
jgi:hypothetical protein